MKWIIRLIRYRHFRPTTCRYCLLNESLGITSYGALGCRFCQQKVDDYINANFTVVNES